MMAGARWVRLDIDYFHNPKVLAAGPSGRDVHLASICWTARFLTDGRIPIEAVDAILYDAGVTGRRTRDVAVARTVQAGLWTPRDDAFEVHDFVEMNGSRSDAEKERERWRERQRNYRRRRNGGGDVTP